MARNGTDSAKAASVFSGLYAITADWTDTDRLLHSVDAAIQGGCRLVQYRNKRADASQRRAQASALLQHGRQHGVTFIINDDLPLAIELGADGVHLGREEIALYGGLSACRSTTLAEGLALGVSCYNQPELAEAAVRADVDYVAFGAFFASSTKPHAAAASTNLLRRADQRWPRPVVGIGGITLENAPSLVAAGVDAIAIIGALWDAPDVAERARKFTALFVETSAHRREE